MKFNATIEIIYIYTYLENYFIWQIAEWFPINHQRK
jgi:hypothetical protein